jgi:hypothetical protein
VQDCRAYSQLAVFFSPWRDAVVSSSPGSGRRGGGPMVENAVRLEIDLMMHWGAIQLKIDDKVYLAPSRICQ